MRIEANKYVSLDYTLTLDSGEVVDKSEKSEPLAFIYGSGSIIGGLEKALFGLEPGAARKVTVEAEEGYGPVRPELVQKLPRRHFPPEVAEGMTFEAEGGHGPVLLLVKQVEADGVLVDLNHPLAGKRLHFDVRVADVRDPTAEELQLLVHGGCEGCAGHDGHGGGCDCG